MNLHSTLALSLAGLWALAPSTVAKETFMVPMSDGVKLATDVHYPPFGKGPWPAMLLRTPYNKNLEFLGPLWRLSGYATVVQDTRGRFASGGFDRVFIDDGWGLPPWVGPGDHYRPGRDGYDTVEWIREQSWCDGRIGTTGASALGITQNFLAGTRGNRVDAQCVKVAATEAYFQSTFQGGAFREELVEMWLAFQDAEHMLGFYEDHPTYDNLWKWMSLNRRVRLVEQPALHIGGWYDIYSRGTLDGFSLRQEQGGEGARGNQKLIMGPWTHYVGDQSPGELAYPNSGFAGAYELIGSEGDWFEYWLKGIPNGVMELSAGAFYQMGPAEAEGPWNEWRAIERWPPPHEPTSLYLTGAGELSWLEPSAVASSSSYLYDPENPVPTIGGANLFIEMGPMDQRSVESRDDVVLFRTELLAAPVEVAGPVHVDLWIESDGPDTDFTAKLVDVYPDGRSMLVCDGILRARYRSGFESEDFLVPGERVSIRVDLWDTAITFGAGHRIGLDISSSNWPRFDVNPNTGEPVRRHTSTRVATNTLHHDALYLSRLVLPVATENP